MIQHPVLAAVQEVNFGRHRRRSEGNFATKSMSLERSRTRERDCTKHDAFRKVIGDGSKHFEKKDKLRT
jgi:hypothetical protein